VKHCIAEFNRVNTRQRMGRVLRAREFKDKFQSYNVELRCAVCMRSRQRVGHDTAPRSELVLDLTAVSVAETAEVAKQAKEEARKFAEAHRRDLAGAVEEVRKVSACTAHTQQPTALMCGFSRD
jgi:hypothetical protein